MLCLCFLSLKLLVYLTYLLVYVISSWIFNSSLDIQRILYSLGKNTVVHSKFCSSSLGSAQQEKKCLLKTSFYKLFCVFKEVQILFCSELNKRDVSDQDVFVLNCMARTELKTSRVPEVTARVSGATVLERMQNS